MPEEFDVTSLDFGTDPSKLPTSRQLPIGDILVKIKNFKGGKTKATDELSDAERASGKVGGRVTVSVQVNVDQPERYRGTMHTHTFWIGDDADPEAKSGATWARNGTDLMKLFKEAGVGLAAGTKPAEAMEAAKEQTVGAHVYLKVSKKIDPKTGSLYPSRPEIGSWFKPGSREVKVIEESSVEVGDAVSIEAVPSSDGLSQND